MHYERSKYTFDRKKGSQLEVTNKTNGKKYNSLDSVSLQISIRVTYFSSHKIEFFIKTQFCIIHSIREFHLLACIKAILILRLNYNCRKRISTKYFLHISIIAPQGILRKLILYTRQHKKQIGNINV